MNAPEVDDELVVDDVLMDKEKMAGGWDDDEVVVDKWLMNDELVDGWWMYILLVDKELMYRDDELLKRKLVERGVWLNMMAQVCTMTSLLLALV